jgi:putative radical SAM enzyme (TIGR03279 family)
VTGGEIEAIAPGSLGARIGLQPSDRLLAINGEPVRDVIDVRFLAAEEELGLRIERDGEPVELQVQRHYDEPLGLSFVRPTFDVVIRRCNNRCEFCFVTQMPPGLRPSLYVKDDDYRHSFLFGNYVTLTNLTPADWERIEVQHLSPLYVSVHATDPGLRRRVLRNPTAPDVMAQLHRLAEIGIEVHTQIVVTPGLNDGPHLDRSIGDLARLYPAVRSVSVVPLGLTRYHRGGCRVHTRPEMRVVFDQVTAWQRRLEPELGARFAHLSDEWYLRLEEPVPPAAAYDGLDLTENGVGLVRRFLDSGGVPKIESGAAATLVTGTLFAPVLKPAVAGHPNVEVVPVVNRFFGETVTVAGLLTAEDVIAQLRERRLGDTVVLPAAMFGGPEGQSLDGIWPEDVAEALGRPVVTPSPTETSEVQRTG